MDRQKARLMIDDVTSALQTLEKKYGVNLTPVRCTFTERDARMRIEFSEPSATGEIVDQDAVRLDSYAEMYGLPKNVRGKTFTESGRKFTVVGLANRRQRCPVLVDREDGKKFKYPVGTVKALLAQE